jgi:hypothetical protein
LALAVTGGDMHLLQSPSIPTLVGSAFCVSVLLLWRADSTPPEQDTPDTSPYRTATNSDEDDVGASSKPTKPSWVLNAVFWLPYLVLAIIVLAVVVPPVFFALARLGPG